MISPPIWLDTNHTFEHTIHTFDLHILNMISPPIRLDTIPTFVYLRISNVFQNNVTKGFCSKKKLPKGLFLTLSKINETDLK